MQAVALDLWMLEHSISLDPLEAASFYASGLLEVQHHLSFQQVSWIGEVELATAVLN